MSKYIINQGCEMCGKHEVGLCTLTIGKTKHHLCYDCMASLALDIREFAKLNLTEEMKKLEGADK